MGLKPLLSVLLSGWVSALPGPHDHPRHPAIQSPYTLFVTQGEPSQILTLSFDPTKSTSESLQIIRSVQSGFQPGWITAHGSLVCSVSRTKFTGEDDPSGGIFTFRRQSSCSRDGKQSRITRLKPLSSTSSMGKGAVSCDISRDGRTLSSANM